MIAHRTALTVTPAANDAKVTYMNPATVGASFCDVVIQESTVGDE